MHKRASFGLATALALVAAAPASAAFTQTFELSLTKQKVNASTGFDAKLSSSDDTAPNQKPKAVSSVRITFPAGTKFDTSVPAVCTLTTQALAANPAGCAAAEIGKGDASANAKPLTPVDIAETVTAYNANKGILFLLRPKGTVGQTFALKGTLSGRTLSVTVPTLKLLGVDIVLTKFNVTINAKSKGRGKKAKFYARTPPTCTGTWTTGAIFSYADGSTQTVKSTEACTKPKKKK